MKLYTEAMMYLLREKPFYADFLIQFHRVFTKDVPTAGVGIDRGIPMLYINEDFMKSLPNVQTRAEILQHEVWHFCAEHVTNIRIGTGNLAFDNLCADLSINDYLPNLKKMGVHVELINDKYNLKLEKYKQYEYYIENLKHIKGQVSEDFEHMQIDDHSKFGTEPGGEAGNKELIKDMIKKAKSRCGQVPAELKELVNEFFKSKVDWRKQLQDFVAKTVVSKYNFTRKRRNRRHGLLIPGRKKRKESKIAVIVDTSGSMMSLFGQVWGELVAISKHTNITVIEADADVHRTYEFDANVAPEFQGCGGTAYAPALKHADELDVSGIIYIGDMDCFDAEHIPQPKAKVLWAIMGGRQEPPAKFGSKIYIEESASITRS